MKKAQVDLSKRCFMKNVALTGVAVGAASLISVTKDAQAAQESKSIYESVMGDDSARLYTRKGKSPGPVGPIAFEERSIPKNEISSTMKCDVLVVGAGISGLIATLKAAEEGAKVMLIEKMTVGRGCFEALGSVGSKVQNAKGVVTDKEQLFDEMYRSAQWRITPGPIRTYIEKSGEATDFLQAMFDKGGNGFVASPIPLPKRVIKNGLPVIDAELGFYDTPGLPADVRMRSGHVGVYIQRDLVKTAAKYPNVTIKYEMPAVQLIRNNKGRVTGAIAKQNGKYIQIDASKGVILTTGGYDANPEMMQAYLRPEDYVSSSWWNPCWGTTGDGHMMGLKIGASMDSVPHAVMNFTFGSPESFQRQEVRTLRRMGLYIMVNKDGKRFVREDIPFQGLSNAQNAQYMSGSDTWMVFDDTMISDTPESVANVKKVFPELKAKGWLFEGTSPKALASAMKINVKGFEKTISDFNQYKKQDKDKDFSRDMNTAKQFEGKNYYALLCNSCILATVSGLTIDELGRVIGTDNKVIEGLYAAGNVSGNFFSGNYPRHIPGTSMGRAVTFGYVAARHAVKGA